MDETFDPDKNVKLASHSASETASISENEDAVRNLKASQSVEAAFLAVGISNPPNDVAAIITNQVKSAIKNLPLDQVRNMTPGSGPLGTALAAVDQYVGMLTPQQRSAAEKGVNELGPAAMLRFHALMNRLENGSGGGETASSSRRFESINQAFTETQKQALDLARKVGLDWVANNPDLLRLGPAAIQALADVHLRKDSYDGLKGVGYSAGDVVTVAKFAKRKHLDANELARTIKESNEAATEKSDGSTDKPMLNELRKVQTEYMAKPDDPAARKKYDESMGQMKKAHPEKVKDLDRGVKALGQQAKAETGATATANKTEAKKNVTKSKLLAALD